MVDAVRGMARRPFDPAAEGWEKVAYRRGDILDRGSLAALFEGADVVVHLAFAIFGSREETRRVNLEGSRNVFEAAVVAGVKRLVYASSVAAYGFHADNPQPLTEEVPARGSESFYYSAQKAELESALGDLLAGSGVEAYVFRPCIVAGPRATMLIEQTVGGVRLGDPLPALAAAAWAACRCSVPSSPTAACRSSSSTTTTSRGHLVPRSRANGPPGAYNLAGDGGDRRRRHRPRARLAHAAGAGCRRRRRRGRRQADSPFSRPSWSGRPPSPPRS